MLKSRTYLSAVGAIVALFAVGDALANCAGKWPLKWKMPISSGDYGDSLKAVLSQGGFHRAGSVRNYDNRLSFAKTPGGQPGIRMNVKRGENKIVSFDTKPLGTPGASKACISVDVYFSSGFDWNTAGTKIGVGLWGGDTDSNNSGGVPPQLQEGWSVRMVNSFRGARAYSYHLNRDGKLTTESRCKPYKCEYGDTLGNYGNIKKGAWNNVQIEVQMNTIGSSNGTLRAWVNGKQTISKTNIKWRTKSSWAIKGFKFTDMWGGNTSAKVNFSPRSQEMFYRNIKLYGSGGSSSSSSTGTRVEASTVSGSFAPIFPTSGASVKPFKTVAWKSHKDADRYFVRIVDRSNFKTKLSKSYTAYTINCFGANKLCEIPVSSSFTNSEHRLILRAVRNNGSKLKEYSFDFRVSSSGKTYAGQTGSSAGGSSSSTPTSSSSSSASVKAQSPSGTVRDRTPTLRWTGGKFDWYYVKIVNDQGKTVYTKTIKPSAASCNNDTTCNFTVASLRVDNYKWHVRGVKNKVKGGYSTLAMNVK